MQWSELTATTSEIDGSSKRIESSPNQSPRLSVIGLVDSNVVAVRSASWPSTRHSASPSRMTWKPVPTKP